MGAARKKSEPDEETQSKPDEEGAQDKGGAPPGVVEVGLSNGAWHYSYFQSPERIVVKYRTAIGERLYTCVYCNM